MSNRNKRLCTECNWKGMACEQLEADNPFDPEDVIVGCPKCFSVNTLRGVCDEEGCWEESSCGFPTFDNGYRRTCSKHSNFKK